MEVTIEEVGALVEEKFGKQVYSASRLCMENPCEPSCPLREMLQVASKCIGLHQRRDPCKECLLTLAGEQVVGADDAKLLEAIEAKHNAHAAAVEEQRKGDGIPLALHVQSPRRSQGRIEVSVIESRGGHPRALSLKELISLSLYLSLSYSLSLSLYRERERDLTKNFFLSLSH